MSCNHFNLINSQQSFLTPNLTKITWTCLYDGCIKIKKNTSRQQLEVICQKYTQQHKVMINCQSFEIYCTQCKQEVYDDEIENKILNVSDKNGKKYKKYAKKDPFSIRQLLISNQQTEDLLFAGNSQYPPSFQKQKQGFCGLSMNSVSSYMNSVIHLMAYIPIIRQISRTINLSKVQNKFLKHVFEAIDIIWSGRYRIYKIDQMQNELILEDNNFKAYINKTPQHFLYFVMKKILSQFCFSQLHCFSGQIIKQSYLQWRQPVGNIKNYSLLKDIFSGSCQLEKKCKCGNVTRSSNIFECLKVNFQKSQYHDNKIQINLYNLIEQSFNWRNNHSEVIKQIEAGRITCERCGLKINQYFMFVDLPNNLIIQFGEEIQGLNVCLPDQINLIKFTQQYVKRTGGKSADNKDAVYQFVGSIFRKDKRYITHIKGTAKKQYNFSDQIIVESDRNHCQTKIAIYKRTQNKKNQPLYKNIVSCLEVNVNPIVPLPDFWSLLLRYNFKVQPLMNQFVCTHGKLYGVGKESKMKGGCEKIPIQIYQYLLDVFGGRQVSSQFGECPICIDIFTKIDQIKESEKQLASFADKLSNKKQRVLISRAWLQSWQKYIYGNPKKGYKQFINLRPGPINNEDYEVNNPKRQKEKFKKISPQVWLFLFTFYGGGPMISNQKFNPNIVLKTSVKLRYEVIRPIIIQVYGQNTHLLQKSKQHYYKKQIPQENEDENTESIE